MDEPTYQKLADTTFRILEAMLDRADTDEVDVERAGDVITITFRDKKRCVVNTQRPTRQIWLAADAQAWHFDFDHSTRKWLDDKGKGVELIDKIADIVMSHSGIDLR